MQKDFNPHHQNNTADPEISVIVPVYGCAECLISLCDRLTSTLMGMSVTYEILLINDKSPDNAWPVIQKLASADRNIKGINLSRNFGQHYAISAGYDFATGNWVVVMDCDLQDQPEDIRKLYDKAIEGFDIVYGISQFRGNRSFLRKFLRNIYFRLYDSLAKNEFKTENLSFYIVNKQVRNAIIKFREQSRHISSLLRHVGFNIVGIDVDHQERQIGKSSYTLRKRVQLALVGIIAHSSTLLRASLYIGFLFSFFSFGYGIFILIRKLFSNDSVMGWTSIITFLVFSTGLILCVLGIIGIYLEKIYLEVKQRPLYVIKESVNIFK
ncbi:MAG: glycosyltransferase family 2 protein [Bacteroidetes bacterium]|nr:glycosyltransferase family 2 protein [Bacteroidota bacterium]